MLIIDNISVTCQDVVVLEKLSLQVSPSELSVIMGPNGSGKSTLAYTLMGHPNYKVTSGSILFNGLDLLELPIEKRARAGLFLACQNPLEIPGVKVITFLKEAYRMNHGLDLSFQDFEVLLKTLFQEVNLDENFIYRNLNEGFSGGEKKKLEVIQLLLLKPKLAIIDEIDSGLDIDALKIIAQALVRARAQNPTMSLLIITHYSRILSYIAPDKVHILSNGSFKHSGDQSLIDIIERKGYNELSL